MGNNEPTTFDHTKKKSPVKATIVYAGFKERLFAYLIDVAIVWTPFILISKFSTNPDNSLLRHWSSIIILFGVYYALMESSDSQATLGKRIFKLKVITESGDKLTFKKAYYRYGVSLLSILPLGFGIWAMLNDEKKQTWHDQLLGCYVVVDKEPDKSE